MGVDASKPTSVSSILVVHYLIFRMKWTKMPISYVLMVPFLTSLRAAEPSALLRRPVLQILDSSCMAELRELKAKEFMRKWHCSYVFLTAVV